MKKEIVICDLCQQECTEEYEDILGYQICLTEFIQLKQFFMEVE